MTVKIQKENLQAQIVGNHSRFSFFSKILSTGLSIILVATLISCSKESSMNLKVSLISNPDSFDPIDYDLLIHHVIQNSVLAPLLSKYSNKGYYPIIAKSWKSENEYTKWIFNLRDDLTFSNGKKITADDVALSFKRMIFLQKQRGSKNNWTNFLKGFESINHIQENLEGLVISDSKLIFTFVKPMPGLLEEISFGIYSIVSPDDYNANNGKWNDPKKVTASYQYQLEKWDENNKQLELKLRSIDFTPEIKKYKKIDISWVVANQKKSQIIMATSFDDSLGEQFTFYGPLKAGTFYLHLWNWNQVSSEFSDINFRKNFRELLYKEMERNNIQVTRSFFPLAITGVMENTPSKIELTKLSKKNDKITFVKQVNIENSQFRKNVQQAIEALAKNNLLILEPSPIQHKDTRLWHDPTYNKEKADISIRATSILVERPDHDMRFMFLSREGICLPDTDGSIHKELEKEKLDYDKINKLLWDQSVIIPVSHYSSGIRVSNEVDLSQYNINLPPIDFTFIQKK